MFSYRCFSVADILSGEYFSPVGDSMLHTKLARCFCEANVDVIVDSECGLFNLCCKVGEIFFYVVFHVVICFKSNYWWRASVCD